MLDTIYKFVHAIIAALLLTSCASLEKKLWLNEDNVLEESVESVLEKELDVSLDLTPSTPEKK